jgi:hypothetical protein
MNWISIKDRTPEMGQVCIVCADGIPQFMALAWNGDCFEWADGYTYEGESAFDPFPSETATHWMLLPEPPK